MTNEVVFIVGVYFKCANEKVLFLYPTLFLNALVPFKVMRGKEMVVEEATTSPGLEHPPTHEKGEAREGGKLESPHQEHVIVEE